MPEQTQKALISPEPRAPWKLVTDYPIDPFGPTEVRIKVVTAALNPADWKVQVSGGMGLVSTWPFIGGLDGAGVIEEVGAEVTNVVKGDKVLFPGGFEAVRATFKQFVTCPAEHLAKIPDNLTFEQAASVPLGMATVVSAIWGHVSQELSISLTAPWEEGGKTKYAGQAAFIVGGSSSVGQYAIQMARLNGFSPIVATSSLKHAEFLKNLGATHIIDRSLSSDAILAKLRECVGGVPVTYAYDAVSEKDTQPMAYDALAEGGALVVAVSRFTFWKERVKPGDGKRVSGPFATLTLPENAAVGKELYKHLGEWLRTGVVIPNRVEVLAGGLSGIPAGLKRMQDGAVSGTKLIARIDETE